MAVCGGDVGIGFLPAEDARTKSRDDWTIFCEIQGIQNAILEAIGNCSYSVTISDNTPMTELNAIEGITVVDGGMGYFPTVAEAVFHHPTGTGAEAEVITVNGVITDIRMLSGGDGYEPIVAEVDHSALSGSHAHLIPIVINGMVTDIIVDGIHGQGSGYTVGDEFSIMHPTGSGAVGRITAVGDGGKIIGVAVVTPGSGYDAVSATIEIVHPTGMGFNGVVDVDAGSVRDVAIVDGGLLYDTIDPTVVIDDTIGAGFVGEIAIDVNGTITGVTVVDGGSNYSMDSEVVVVSDKGTGAMLTIDWGDCASCKPCATGHCPKYTPHDYYQVYNGTEDNKAMSEQMNTVLGYFSKLGYKIRLMTNPETGDTLQWLISW